MGRDFVDGKCSQVRRNRPCCGRFRDCKGFRPFAGHHSAPPSLPDMPKRTTFLMVCFCCCIVSCVSGVYGNYGEGAYSPSIPDIPSSAPIQDVPCDILECLHYALPVASLL